MCFTREPATAKPFTCTEIGQFYQLSDRTICYLVENALINISMSQSLYLNGNRLKTNGAHFKGLFLVHIIQIKRLC